LNVKKEKLIKIIEGLFDVDDKSVKNALISVVNRMDNVVSVNDSVYRYIKNKNAFGCELSNKDKIVELWNNYGDKRSKIEMPLMKTNPSVYSGYLLSECLDEKDPTLNNKIIKWSDGNYPQYIESIRLNYKNIGMEILERKMKLDDDCLQKEKSYQEYLRCNLLRDLVNCKENILVSLRTYNMLSGVLNKEENK
jgi:hypothetical protein